MGQQLVNHTRESQGQNNPKKMDHMSLSIYTTPIALQAFKW
jgi:hypothetical protein